MGEIGAQVIDLATTVDTLRGTNIAKEESTLNRLSDTTYDDIYQVLSEIKDNVTERDIQNYLFQQRLQDYTNQSDFGTGSKYNRAIQAVTAFTQGMMGGNIVTAIANGSGVKTACGNTLGRCAEFRAANELMLSNPNLKVKDIQFTPAVRPRTGEVVPRCDNCTNMFGAE
ncbi:hypothetical protein ACBQ20_17850 [Proteus vulgaris]|uniref:hypothetical protein n=1 Tax=Proteus vulgaris TaxID=585 RepID=UPI0035257C4A